MRTTKPGSNHGHTPELCRFTECVCGHKGLDHCPRLLHQRLRVAPRPPERVQRTDERLSAAGGRLDGGADLLLLAGLTDNFVGDGVPVLL